MISVVIPAYNEEKTIGYCLESLANQQTTKKYEVIVVDNCSIDKTNFIASSFKNKLNLRIIRENQKGRGMAREAGFRIAAGDIILSTDADAVLPNSWIETLVNALYSKNTSAVTGTCKIVDGSLFTNKFVNIFQPLAMRFYKLVFRHYWLSGFNFGIFKKDYQKTKGFNRKLNVQEDIELSFQVSKIGKIIFLPNIPVTVSGRRYKKGLIKEIVPYVSTFVKYFVFHNESVFLSDIR